MLFYDPWQLRANFRRLLQLKQWPGPVANVVEGSPQGGEAGLAGRRVTGKSDSADLVP